MGQALPDVPGVLKIDFIHTVGLDTNARVTLHQEYSGTIPVIADLAEYAGDLTTSWTANCAPLAPGGTDLTNVIVTDLTSRTSAIGQNPGVSGGTRGASELPGAVAALVDNPVLRRFRGGHYRSYWPFGVQTDLLNAQTWQNAFIVAVEAGIAALRSDMQTSIDWGGAIGGNSCGVSYFEGFIAVVNPVTGRTKDVPKLRVGGPVVDDFHGPAICKPKPSFQTRRGLLSA